MQLSVISEPERERPADLAGRSRSGSLMTLNCVTPIGLNAIEEEETRHKTPANTLPSIRDLTFTGNYS